MTICVIKIEYASMERLDLSRKLKEARLEAGLKQEEIAALMDLPISGISVIESGNRKVDVIELTKFAKFYSKPIEWFFYGKNDKNHRRWYDGDKKVAEAITLLQKAPIKYQKSCACAIIGFLKDSGLIE